jgi:hypothetical protein
MKLTAKTIQLTPGKSDHVLFDDHGSTRSRLYNESNNGFLALPSRAIGNRMNVAHQTVARSLSRLNYLRLPGGDCKIQLFN